MAKRLGVIVSCDCTSELRSFLTHICSYFCHDKRDRDIPVRILVVKRANALPFNRGLLNNIGFQFLAPEVDCVCFHDAHHLPLWTDYSWWDNPVAIFRDDLQFSPCGSSLAKNHQGNRKGSAVLLMPSDQFERINGYSNLCWSGFEDVDLIHRFTLHGVTCLQRDGTFMTLQSDDKCRDNPSKVETAETYQVQKSDHPNRWKQDGVSSASFDVVRRCTMPSPEIERDILVEHVVVEFPHRPA